MSVSWPFLPTVVIIWFKGFCAIWIRDSLCEIFLVEGLHHWILMLNLLLVEASLCWNISTYIKLLQRVCRSIIQCAKLRSLHPHWKYHDYLNSSFVIRPWQKDKDSPVHTQQHMYRAGSGFLEKQAKEGVVARNHGKVGAGLVAGKETGDTGCCLVLPRGGHSRSSHCLLLPSSSCPPALWFSRGLGDLSVLPDPQAGPALLQKLQQACGLTSTLCLAPLRYLSSL